MLLTLIALILTLFPPKIADGFAVFLTLSYALAYAGLRDTGGKEQESRGKTYLKAMILASVIVFGNFFGVSSYVIAASLILYDVHFLLEVTGMRERFVSISGYGALFFVFAYSLAGMLYFYLCSMVGIKFSVSYMLFLSLVGALSASLMEYVRADKSIIILASSTTYLVFTIYAIQTTILYLSEAFALSFILALLSTKAGVADESGLLSATLIGTVIIIFTDIRYFIVILAFYIAGSAATKYMYRAKYESGIAEPAGGARGFVNVFSNSLPALFFAVNYGFYGVDAFKLAFVASVATALGDTMASEIGKTSENVYLITNFSKVKPGTNGGISLKGELAAVAGCLIISVLAWILKIIPVHAIPITFAAAFTGVHIDSLLGATLEERGLLNNAGVNFFATLAGGLLCLIAR